MPAARGVKRAASKSSAPAASSGPKNKKKRGAIQLEIPSAPKRRGRVMTCGQGDVGQLGLGEDVIETNKFKYVTGLGDNIVDIRAGGMHTVALDSNGKVWTFGCNDEGALGRPTSSDKDEGTPKQVTLPEEAVRIAAGDSHSAALLSTGDVYAWGSFRDSHGSMGLVMRGREGKACKEPVHIQIPEQAVDIASGGDHLVILTTTGAVYTMGCGEQGQLGRLAQRSASRDARQGFSALLVPSKVTLKIGVSRIWAGYHATFALDANSDKMFAWGLNNYGQLGITGDKRLRAVYSPTECDAFTTACADGAAWAGVACGQHHSLALDSAGAVFAIGRCEYGRLGLPVARDAYALVQVPALRPHRAVGVSAATSSSFAVTADGAAYAWGMGSEGQLGTGSAADAPQPARAAHPARAAALAAGGQHTVLLVEAEQPEHEAPETEATHEPNTPHEPHEPHEPEPQKVNGDETETPMEVDDTDKSQEEAAPSLVVKESVTDNASAMEEQPTSDAAERPESDTCSADTADAPVGDIAPDTPAAPAEPAAPGAAATPAAPAPDTQPASAAPALPDSAPPS